MVASIVVEFGGGVWSLDPAVPFTFGRAEDGALCLDATDMAISRRAGVIELVEGIWWLANRSTTRPFAVIDDQGLRKVLGPGQRIPVEEPLWVVVDGSRSYRLRLTVDRGEAGGADADADAIPTAAPGAPTVGSERVLVSAADRLAMTAMFAEYLEDPPRSDPLPKTYRAAATRLGWPRTTLAKRIEHLRERLDKAGVPNMTGLNALANLAEYALAQRLVTKDDLRRLRGEPIQ
jgi:hypothetical protein